MTLYKRGGVYWSYVFQEGVRHARSTKTGNRRLAEQIDHKHKEELLLRSAQLTELKPQMKFAELAGHFLAEGEAREWHRDRLKVLLPYFSDMMISRIGKAQVRQYRQARHESKTLTETTLNRDIECLRHLLYWAVDEGLLAINPLARIRLARIRRKKKPVLSSQEEKLLLQVAAPHLQNIIIAGVDAGLRRGEILNQRWDDVDFSRCLLYVSRSKTPEGESREIPLTGRLLHLLSELPKNGSLVFTFGDKPIHSVKTAWKTAIRRAGIRYIQFHYLRHTFNTRLLELSVTREVRMALLGHTFGDTHESYEHVELPLKREAIRKLDAWLANEATTQKESDGSTSPKSNHADEANERLNQNSADPASQIAAREELWPRD